MLEETRLRRVVDVSRTVVSELDLETVLQRVLEEARELTGARYAALGILDGERRALERFLTIGIDPETHRAIGDLPRGRGVLGVLIRDPKPLRLDDVGDHPRSYGFPLGHPPMRSFLGVPDPRPRRGLGQPVPHRQGRAAPHSTRTTRRRSSCSPAGPAWRSTTPRLHQRAGAAGGARARGPRAGGDRGDRARGRRRDRPRPGARARRQARARACRRARHADPAGGRRGARGHGGRRATRSDLAGHARPAGGLGRRVGDARRAAPGGSPRVSEHLRFALGGSRRCDDRAAGAAAVPRPAPRRPRGVRPREGTEFTAEDEQLLEASPPAPRPRSRPPRTSPPMACAAASRPPSASATAGRASCTTRRCRRSPALKVMLSGARRQRGPRDAIERCSTTAVDQIGDAIATLRRLITDLRPAALDEFGIGGRARGARGARRADVGPRHRPDRTSPTSRARGEPAPARVEDARLPHRAGGAHERRQARARDPCHRDDHGGRARRDPARRRRRRHRHPGDRRRQRP